MATPRVKDLVCSLMCEVENTWRKEWSFDDSPIREVHEQENSILLTLESGIQLQIEVKELPGDSRLCRPCQTVKGDWPLKWRNISSTSTLYACEDCVQKNEKALKKVDHVSG